MTNRIFGARGCPTSDDLRALVDGGLSADRIGEIESHLAGCPVCVGELDSLTPSLPDELWEAMHEPNPALPGWAGRCLSLAGGTPPPDPADEGPQPFERKNQYRSEKKIGGGGMGDVYKAWEFNLSRDVAIKIPSPRLRSPRALARFLEEAARLAQLKSPYIVTVYARDEHEGVPYFAMEFVEGRSLAAVGGGLRSDPRRVAEVMRQVATGVRSAHAVGVFHLDLKPSNVMLATDGTPKILDFGLARWLGGPEAGGRGPGWGTPEYMPPEAWEHRPEGASEPTDAYARSDVYGLGAILYELLTGRAPFDRAPSREEARRRSLHDNPEAPSAHNPEVPRRLEAICLKCLRKRPEERYPTARAVAEALGRYLDDHPDEGASWPSRLAWFVRRHRTGVAAACVAMAALAGVSGGLVDQRRKHQQSEAIRAQSEAIRAFDGGRQMVKEGRIVEGYEQMRAAINMLPIGETVYRAYFERSVEALRGEMCFQATSLTLPVRALASSCSPDGRYALIGDGEGGTTLWDIAEDTPARLPAQPGRGLITATAFSPDGALCASGDESGGVVVWGVRTREPYRTLRLGGRASALGFLRDGYRLLTGTLAAPGPGLRVWDLETDPATEWLAGAGDLGRESAMEVVASPSGDRFVSISAAGRCLLWDAEAGAVLATLRDTMSDRSAGPGVAFSADGKRLAVADGGALTIHDGATGEARGRSAAACRGGRVHCVTFRDDGGLSLVLDVELGAVVRRVAADLSSWDDVAMERPASPSDVAEFAGRDRVLAGRMTPTLRLFDVPPPARARADLGTHTVGKEIAVSGDGSRIATLALRLNVLQKAPRLLPAADRPRLQLWNARALSGPGPAFALPGDLIASKVAFGPDADVFAVGCSRRETPDGPPGEAPVLLGIVSPDGSVRFEPLGAHASTVIAMAFTPDGRRLITASSTGPDLPPAELTCWGIDPVARPLWRIPYPTTVTAIAATPDGRRFLVGGRDGIVRLLSADRPSEAPSSVRVGDWVRSIAHAHHAPLVAVRGTTDRITLLEIAGGALVRRDGFRQPGADGTRLAFSPVDDTLYVQGDRGVHRWDVGTRQPIEPAIVFGDKVRTFALGSRPEAVIAITNGGSLFIRSVRNPAPADSIAGGPRSKPFGPN